jgi:hypothetical protein
MATTLVEIAEGFLEIARTEAREGYDRRDERRIRDAAEKAWLAATQVVDHAMHVHGQMPPQDPRDAHAARHRFLEDIGRRDLSRRLAYFADRLHGTCCYIGRCPTRSVMDAILDEADQYVATFRAGV